VRTQFKNNTSTHLFKSIHFGRLLSSGNKFLWKFKGTLGSPEYICIFKRKNYLSTAEGRSPADMNPSSASPEKNSPSTLAQRNCNSNHWCQATLNDWRYSTHFRTPKSPGDTDVGLTIPSPLMVPSWICG